jgi:glycosyltransferase involved in cell wall biosynthesis
MARPIADTLKRPVCCTLQGEDLFLSGLISPYRERALELIRREVPSVDRFIAVSEFCARLMSADLKIPANRMAIVPLGINAAGYERGERGKKSGPAANHGQDDAFRVGYLARVAPEKGLHLLADAFQRFRRRKPEPRARLDVAGYLAGEHRAYLSRVEQSLNQAGLGADFTYHGVVDLQQKHAFLRVLDVLSVPATYDEPKGIFLLEAMASGVPVVQPRRGAFTEVVEKTGGGLLVDPDNPDSLADGLETLYRNRPLREELGDRAYRHVRAHYTVQRSADRLMDVYEELAGRPA